MEELIKIEKIEEYKGILYYRNKYGQIVYIVGLN